jgi:8-oxo-dGTP diphosphatase
MDPPTTTHPDKRLVQSLHCSSKLRLSGLALSAGLVQMKERIRRLDAHSHANGKPLRFVVAALILRTAAGENGSATEVLVCQRRADQPMSLKWEFPGGKIEPGETAEQALSRELDEELGIAAVIGPRVTQLRHRYRNGSALDLQFFTVRDFTGEIDNRIFNQVRWSPLVALPTFDFLAADLGLIRDLSEGKLL